MSGVEAMKARLFGGLRNEFVQRASHGRWADAESREWGILAVEHRLAFLLLAGIDGDLPTLARREWREMPGPERDAIKAEARRMRDAVRSVAALTGRW